MRTLLKTNFALFWKQIRFIWAVQFIVLFAGYCAGFFLKPEYTEIYSSLMTMVTTIFPLSVFVVGPGSVFWYFGQNNKIYWMSSEKPFKILSAALITSFVYYAGLLILFRLFLMLGCSIGSWGVKNMEVVRILSWKKIPVSYKFYWATSSVAKRLGLLFRICAANSWKTLFLIFMESMVGLGVNLSMILGCVYNKKKQGVFRINILFSVFLFIPFIALVMPLVRFFIHMPVTGIYITGSLFFVLLLGLYLWISSSLIEKYLTL